MAGMKGLSMSDERTTKEAELEEFLRAESSQFRPAAVSPAPALSNPGLDFQNPPSSVPKQPSVAVGLNGEPRQRHNLKSCACEVCQQKRVALARKFSIISGEEASQEELPEIDTEAIGKLLTVPHTYMATVNAVKYPEIAAIWKVSEATEESLGKFGNAVLGKWLKKANFPYKTEVILGLYWSSDIGIRFMQTAKLKALIDAENKLNK